MAKRAGKAANRRQRQRNAARPARPAPPTMPARGPDALDMGAPMPEPAAPAAPRAAAPAPPPAARPRPGRRGTAMIGGASRLTEQAAAEYHYVMADLRNIAVLFIGLIALLAVAFVIIEVLGIGRVAT